MATLAEVGTRVGHAYERRSDNQILGFCKEPTQLYLPHMGPLDHSRPMNAPLCQRRELQASNQVEAVKPDPISEFREYLSGCRFGTVLADPPWRFQNRTGKVAPEHRRLSRYGTMSVEDMYALPVADAVESRAHLYLWVPNALLPQGLQLMKTWGFDYKSNLVWHKVRKDGGPDGRGVGFYFRNTTELVLFGTRGKNARTLPPGRRQVNIIKTRKREHSRKPDELYDLIENCSYGPFLEMFARGERPGWTGWGEQADGTYYPSWKTYPNHSQADKAATRT